MSRGSCHKHITLGLAVWFALQAASIHALHHHALSLAGDNFNLCAVADAVACPHHDAALIAPWTEEGPTSGLGRTPIETFCPVCLFLQNFHSQASGSGTPAISAPMDAGPLFVHYEAPFTTGIPEQTQPRGPPALNV